MIRRHFNPELEKAEIKEINRGEIITGKVVYIKGDTVYLDIGYKFEGRVPIEEFGENIPRVGDEVEVLVVKKDPLTGEVILSKKEAQAEKAWRNIIEIYNSPFRYISGKIIAKKNEKGYIVDLGDITGFLPAREIRKIQDIEEVKDKLLMFKIINLNKARRTIILSRRQYQREVNEQKRKQILSSVNEGDIIEGVVKNITRFGVFIDLGGFDALIPKSEIGWSRKLRPEKIFKINEKIKAYVFKVDREEEHIYLSRKRLLPDPWKEIENKYKPGEVYTGTVIELTGRGAWIELEEGVEGYLPVENISFAPHIRSAKEFLKLNEEIKVKLFEIDKHNQQIILSIKDFRKNPWKEINKKYRPGNKVKAPIKVYASDGVYLELEPEIEGFIPLEEVSWIKTFRTPREAFPEKTKVEAVIYEIDKKNNLVKLSIRRLTRNPWQVFEEKMKNKIPVSVKLHKITPKGAHGKVDGIPAFIPVSHFSERHVDDPLRYFKKGQVIKVMVIEVNPDRKQITVSPREYTKFIAQKELKQYIKEEPTSTFSLQDILENKLKPTGG